MPSLTLKINGLKKLEDALKRKAENLSSANKQKMLNEVGEELLISHEKRFQEERAPDGKAWENLSQKTLDRKRTLGKRSKKLQQDGELKDDFRYQAKSDVLEFGTNLIYARTHQEGDERRNIPARPFLGISREDERTILEVIEERLKR